MKTLKRDGINGKLLLETLAYIETHPDDWNQHEWRCETGMCFAGHAAITIGGARPVAPLTCELTDLLRRSNAGEALTAEERSRVSDWEDAQLYLRPEDIDSPEQIGTVEYQHRNHRSVSVEQRARVLLGPNALSRSGFYLFHGKNRLPSIRKHVLAKLEINEEELGIQLRKIAKRNRWEFPPRSKWAG